MEMDKIITLIKAVSESSLSSFTLEEGNMKLALEVNRDAASLKGRAIQKVESNIPHIDVIEQPEEGLIVKSPLVGVFYTSQKDGAEPFISVGDTVKKGQTIGIVEAMKLMNEVESEYDGVVEEIFVSNEQMVEYGQPLIRIK